MLYYVYGLFVEGSDLPFYIGKGKGSRAHDHLGGNEGGNSHKNNTIRKAQRDGLNISVCFYFETDIESEAFDKERELISKYGRRNIGTGCLTNLTEGGEGASGYKHTPEQIERNRMAHLGSKHSEATKVKMSQVSLGRKKTKEHSANISKGKREFYSRNPHLAESLKGAGNPNADMRPWESSITMKRPLSMKMWAMANEMVDIWLEGGRASLRKHFKSIGLGETSEEGLHNRLKSGWRPLDDKKWVDWSGRYLKHQAS
jgi:hypothetical protein